MEDDVAETMAPLLRVNEPGDQYGYATAAGDFNGDGRDDLAVGAHGESCAAGAGCGAVYVYNGTTNGLAGSRVLRGSSDAGDAFGFALAAGDFNFDGYDDLAVGAPYDEVGAASSGLVFLYTGSASGLRYVGTVSQSGLSVDETGDRFGFALAARHLDGYGAELLVGAPGEIWWGRSAGVVFVFRGSRPGDAAVVTPWTTLSQDQLSSAEGEDGDLFGFTILVRDIIYDSTGAAEVVIGAPGEDGAAGAVYVWRGTFTGPVPYARIDRRPMGTHVAGGYYGRSLAAGRLDGGSGADLAVGAPGEGSWRGAVYWYPGVLSGQIDAAARTRRLAADDFGVSSSYFGWSLAISDVTFNEREDLVVGAPNHTTARGTLFIYRGAEPASRYPDPLPFRALDHGSLATPSPGDFFGGTITVGNFDGDVYPDLAVSAWRDGTHGETAGAVYLYNAAGPLPWHAQSQEMLLQPAPRYRRASDPAFRATLVCREPCPVTDSFFAARWRGARLGIRALVDWLGDDIDGPEEIHLSTDPICLKDDATVVGSSFYSSSTDLYHSCLWELESHADPVEPYDEASMERLDRQTLVVHEYFHTILHRFAWFPDEPWVRSLALVLVGYRSSLCDPFFDSGEMRLVHDLCVDHGLDFGAYSSVFDEVRATFYARRGAGGVASGQTLASVSMWQLYDILARHATSDPMPAFDRAAAAGLFPPSTEW